MGKKTRVGIGEKTRVKDELEEFLPTKIPQPKIIPKDVPIIFDGRQYIIKIPKSIVEHMNIDVRKDRFLFTIITPPSNDLETEPKLIGELKRGNHEKK